MSLSLWKRPPPRWFDALWARLAPLLCVLAMAAVLDACTQAGEAWQVSAASQGASDSGHSDSGD
jgi:hypothetical protein